MTDLYILVPGILGSVLEKDGKDAFGLTAEAGFRALFSGGGSINELRLTEDPPDIDDLGDGIRATRLASPALIPGFWKDGGYKKISEFLRKRFKLVAGETYFEFPYDWRRDNRVAARQLARHAELWLNVHRKNDPNAKLVIVGHSMGGLVARYYLECLGGWKDTRALITLGTPYRGSFNALGFLVNGYTKMFGLVDLSDWMRSFTSLHQLLPLYPCLDLGDGKLARLTEVPGLLPGLAMDKVAAARSFHRTIEDAVDTNIADDRYHSDGYRTFRVIGIDQPTNQSATWLAKHLTLLQSHSGIDHGGDGTVPRVSASPQEAESDEMATFTSTRHAGLQNTDAVLTQVRGWLTGVDLRDFKADSPVTLSLDVEDVYSVNAPVHLTVQPSDATLDLEATLTWIGGPGTSPPPPAIVRVPPRDGIREVELPAPQPGCYQVKLTGGPEVQPVDDLLLVSPR